MSWFNIALACFAVFVILFLLLRVKSPAQAALYASVKDGKFDRWTRLPLVPLFLLLLLGPHRFRVVAGVILLTIAAISVFLQYRRLLSAGLAPDFVRQLTAVFVVGQVSVLVFVIAAVGET